jgi:hypothetical protein
MKNVSKLGMVVHTYNPSMLSHEDQVQGQPGLETENFLKKPKQNELKKCL